MSLQSEVFEVQGNFCDEKRRKDRMVQKGEKKGKMRHFLA